MTCLFLLNEYRPSVDFTGSGESDDEETDDDSDGDGEMEDASAPVPMTTGEGDNRRNSLHIADAAAASVKKDVVYF